MLSYCPFASKQALGLFWRCRPAVVNVVTWLYFWGTYRWIQNALLVMGGKGITCGKSRPIPPNPGMGLGRVDPKNKFSLKITCFSE